MADPTSIASAAKNCGPNMIDAALAYAASGRAVFPLHSIAVEGRCTCGRGAGCESPGKHPRVAHGFKEATTDVATIERWWSKWPDANIGLATGAVSGVFVLDIDGSEGEASLARLVDANGPLPATKIVATGRGMHFYFRYADGDAVTCHAPVDVAFPGIDCRGDGGYVVAPPSIHSSGSRYASSAASVERVADAPAWLLSFVSAASQGKRATQGAANDASIAEGGRNNALTSMAGRMRHAGASTEELESALLSFNAERCQPPLDDDEVRGIARSVGSYPLRDPDEVRKTLTDTGNASRFAKAHSQNCCYVAEGRRWLLWNGANWEPDTTDRVVELAKQVAADICHEGDTVSDGGLRNEIAKHSKNSASAPRLRAMLDLAKSDKRLVVSTSRLDSQRDLLGLQNGTLHLQSGELCSPERANYITRSVQLEFDSQARCPTFLAFLHRIMGGSADLVAYLQRVVGYAISGRTDEQVLFFLYGSGANGKTTFVNVLRDLLGPALTKSMPTSAIAARQQGSGPTPEIARLVGARLVVTSEVEEGSFLDESLVKLLTGGDPVPARELYGAPFEFFPQFKLFVVGNHKPVIRQTDYGIWRRIHMIPFLVRIPVGERDAALPDRLRGELAGILNWAVEGYRAWRADGLRPPEEVMVAVREYQEEMDILGQWIAQCCQLGEELWVGSSDAYQGYRTWAIANGLRPWSLNSWGRRMGDRFERRRSAAGIVYVGLKPRSY